MSSLAIETHGLTRRYGALLAVDRLELAVSAGSVYGFLGPNGAGKTTTIRLLLGLIHPHEGEVRLWGEELARRRTRCLARVGALVEAPALYPHLTGRENLEVTRRLTGATRAQVERALAIVRLTADADRRAGQYSQGMRQRLGLALALLDGPELLVLDEPTNGLDPAGIHEMRELVRRLPAEYGITVFLSSHLLSEIEQMATHLGIIHRGKLLFQGTLAELQAQRAARLRLGVDRPAEALGMLAAAGWAARPSGDHTLLVSATSITQAEEVNALLTGKRLAVHHLALEQPTLEETFLELTVAE